MEEGMHIVENRVASFTEAKSAWPHPDTFIVAPSNLAEAGFYFDPHYAEDDNCVCFLCQKSLGGWEEHDNPITEHITHAPFCAWAKLLCSRLFVTGEDIPLENYDEDDYIPTSGFMEAARAATFQDLWPHEYKKGWLCNVKKMAKAGFHYNPTPDSDDTACCAYCNTTLDGWEPRDSPVKEHRKRAPTCPFFSKDLKTTLKKMKETIEEEADISASSRSSRRGATRNSAGIEASQTQPELKKRKGTKRQKELEQLEEKEVIDVASESREEFSPISPVQNVRDGRKRKKDVDTEEQEFATDATAHNEMDPMEVQALHSDENQFEEEHTPIYKKSKGMENSNIENSKQDDALDTEPNDPIQEKSTEFFGSVAQHFEFIAKNLMEHNNSEVEVQGSDKLNESEVPEEPETDAVSSGEPEVSTAEVWSSAVQAQEDEDQIPTPNDSTQNPVLANDETQDVRDEETPVNGVLNEEEKSMTVEKFVRSLIDKQVKKLQVESEAKIAQFIQEADKIKSMITAMES